MTPAPTRLAFAVPGKPVPKGRPRVTRRNGRPITFTPARTRDYEKRVAAYALQACLAVEWPLRLRARYSATLRFYGARANADNDNLCKSVLDPMQGIVFVNDCQVELLIVERCALKNCASHDSEPRVEVVVEVLP